MKLIKKFPFLSYTALILVFAGFYNLVWCIYPDSFIKNSELNTTPVQDAINLAFSFDNIPDGDQKFITKNSLNEETVKAKKDHHEILVANKKAEEIISSNEIKLSDLRGQLDRTWELNTNIYKSNALNELRSKYISKLIERKEILSNENKPDMNQVGLMLASTDIEIAKINLEIAKKESESINYVLSHAAEFHDPDLLAEYNKINKETELARKQLTDNDKAIISIKNKIQQLLNNLKKDDLNYFDFLYYSIGISTTTTFGDLIANSRYIRLIVCLQLLASIFLLSHLTKNFLSKK